MNKQTNLLPQQHPRRSIPRQAQGSRRRRPRSGQHQYQPFENITRANADAGSRDLEKGAGQEGPQTQQNTNK